jgi:Bacterial TSP3 repeat
MNKRSAAITALVALAMLVVPGAALAKTHHKAKDRNHDGIPDKWEKKHHLSLKVNQAKKDPDHDGLNNKQEFRDNTNPRKADTDGDGLNDGQEMEVGDNPNDPDTDNNGVRDGEEIDGTVQSFTPGTDPNTGTLAILLPDGTNTVTGAVDASTRIECGSGDEHHGLRTSDHGGDGGNRGPGSDNSGPGRGDENGGETGDDNGDQAGNCSTADLTPGAVVHEAKIEKASDGTPTFTKIELESPSSTGTTP